MLFSTDYEIANSLIEQTLYRELQVGIPQAFTYKTLWSRELAPRNALCAAFHTHRSAFDRSNSQLSKKENSPLSFVGAASRWTSSSPSGLGSLSKSPSRPKAIRQRPRITVTAVITIATVNPCRAPWKIARSCQPRLRCTKIMASTVPRGLNFRGHR